MYSVLMVDDEEIALAAMKKGVCWEKLGISEVYTATNIIDARHVFDEHEIEIPTREKIEKKTGTKIKKVVLVTMENAELLLKGERDD